MLCSAPRFFFWSLEKEGVSLSTWKTSLVCNVFRKTVTQLRMRIQFMKDLSATESGLNARGPDIKNDTGQLNAASKGTQTACICSGSEPTWLKIFLEACGQTIDHLTGKIFNSVLDLHTMPF